MVTARAKLRAKTSIDSSRWQQCFLAGIDHMLLGFRDHYGIVQCLQPLTVAEIENRAVVIPVNGSPSASVL